MSNFVVPQLDESAFNCPSCNVYSRQRWSSLIINPSGHLTAVRGWKAAICEHCSEINIWNDDLMIYPDVGAAPLPNPDMPPDVREDYEEARAIVSRSPKAASALLRLAVQRLCKHLGEPGKNINHDIGNLVTKGLLPIVQQALDSVRVIGNNAVHPGEIEINDQTGTANTLFVLVNLIVQQMITVPKQAKQIYDGLPINALAQIAKRDGI